MTEPAEPGKTHWGTAAVVWAFTEPQQGKRTSRTSARSLDIREFAALGIRGLKSDNSVRKYRQAWQHAIDEGGLLSAGHWGTAAVVWAFTREGTGGPRTVSKVTQLSLREFSELGIRGLKSVNSVIKYRQAWQHAIDEGLVKPAEPGKTHWGTAAVVWAFTEDQQGNNQHRKKVSDALGIAAFASLGIRGLTSAPSVRKYRQAWQHAIDEGWVKPAEPGKTPWGTAAVVWAFTREGGQGDHKKQSKNLNSEFLTIPVFAALGIRGLKSDNSVRKYRQAWQHAIDEGWVKPAEPGKTHWGTAAIVWAFTRDQQGRRQPRVEVHEVLGINEFAALGIRGLKSDNSVRKYRQAWQHAIDEGWVKPAEPGKAHWGTAAIVWAFTRDQQGSNQHRSKVTDALGINEFAALKIRGLSSKNSVAKYRQAWQHAIDEGLVLSAGHWAAALSWSLNGPRRHLTQSQKATVAVNSVEVIERLQAEAKKRRKRKPDSVREIVPSQKSGKTGDKVGEVFGVSGRYVSDAAAIKQESPELFKQVEDGEKTIPQAKKEIQPPKPIKEFDLAASRDDAMDSIRGRFSKWPDAARSAIPSLLRVLAKEDASKW